MNLFSIIFALFSLFNQTPHAGVGHFAVARPADTIGGGPLNPATPAQVSSSTAQAKPLDTIGGGPLVTSTPAPTVAAAPVSPSDTIGGGPLPK